MDKISVIVPVYKVEKYIRSSIESILNQTYTNLEIILVDDGSPDDSGKIIDEYAKKDERIKVIHKQNEGVSVARNIGLSMATGDYITFADSDDIVDSREYEVLYNIAKKYDADISMCELERFYENEGINKQEFLGVDEELSKEEALKKIFLDNNVGNYVTIKMFKKELFDGVEFPAGRAYEDVSTVYKLFDKAQRIAYTNQKLYYYLVGREGAITHTFSEKKIKDSMIAYYSQYEFLSKRYEGIKEFTSLIYAKMYVSALEKMCINNYDELYESEEVNQRYNVFNEAMSNVDENTLIEHLNPYRLISAVVLNRSKKLYKDLFNEIYKLK